MNILSWSYQPLPGFKIIQDPNLTEIQEREILIRRKGRGLVLHRKIQEQVPSRDILQVNDTIVIHPAMYTEIVNQIGKSMSDEIDRLATGALLGRF